MSAGGFRLDREAGLARCGALEQVPRLAHAFSLRLPDGEPALCTFLERAGLPGARAVRLRQVHGAAVVRASVPDDTEADAALWCAGDPPGRVPAVRAADCVPILMADVEGRAAAAVHAGWRGTAAGIAAAAVRALGVPPGALVVALGPSIGPCCYEVGPEVHAALGSDSRERGPVDLRQANVAQLVAAGVPRGAIAVAPWCTRCAPEGFPSYRRDGTAAGRLVAVIGPRP